VEQQSIVVNSEFALVQSPLQPVEVLTAADFEVLFIRFTREGVIDELEKLLGQETHSELMFSSAMRLLSAGGRRLRDLCDGLRRTLYTTDEGSVSNSVPLRKLETDFLTLLLQAQPHNYTRLLNRHSAAGAWQIGAAEEYMRANAHLPISLGDVCQAAGVNARTLQDSFRKKRGCTPMRFLREVRMQEVRAGLLRPGEATNVSGEAAHWGFLHFGRFSRDYRSRFGELPSETLRRTRKMPVRPDEQ
jgi:AraC-like DNA-binding protein